MDVKRERRIVEWRIVNGRVKAKGVWLVYREGGEGKRTEYLYFLP